jgi:ankyrin repeat protein
MGTFGNQTRRGIARIDFGKPEPESRVLAGVATAVKLGADVNAVNPAGDTALHTAASQGHDSVVQFLVEHGAKLDIKNKRGQTPLRSAMSGGFGRRGGAAADPNGADLTGAPAAQASGHPSTVALLRKLGAPE